MINLVNSKIPLYKLSIIYTLAFILLYIEVLPIAGVKISVLWKITLMSYILLIVSYKLISIKRIDTFIFFYFLLAVKGFFSISSMDYMLITIELFIKNIFFVGLYLYFIHFISEKKLILIGKYFAILIIISFIPFILNILQPFSEGYGLYRYGAEGEFGLIGIFQRVHAASITVGFSMIIVFFHLLEEVNKKIKYIYIVILLLGLYILIFTYVRTGIVIFFIGFLYLYLKSKIKFKYTKIILITIILSMISVYIYNNNKIIQMRTTDKTIYNNDGAIGSGRFKYAYHAIDNWHSEGFSSIIIGLGQEYARDLMFEDVNNRIFAHNGYVQILQTEGLIGIILFILFLIYLIKFLYNKRFNSYYKINIAIFLAYLTMMFLQGGVYFYMMLYIALYLALLNKKDKKDIT